MAENAVYFLVNSKQYIWGRTEAQICRTAIYFLWSAGAGPVTSKSEFLEKDITTPNAETSFDPIQRKHGGQGGIFRRLGTFE